MTKERICICCGKKYKYCPTCASFKNLPKWKAMFDEQECKDVFDIISSYNTGSLSASDAKEEMSVLDLNGISFKDNIQAKIDEIMSSDTAIADEPHDEPAAVEQSDGCNAEYKAKSTVTLDDFSECAGDNANYDLDAAIDEMKTDDFSHRHKLHKKKFGENETSAQETEQHEN